MREEGEGAQFGGERALRYTAESVSRAGSL